MFDFVTAFERAVRIKWLSFAVDLVVAVLFSLSFGCAMIAYSNGKFRWFFLLCSFVAVVLYIIVFHRLLYKMWRGIFTPLKLLAGKVKKTKK